MFRFEHSEHLIFLLLIPILVVIFVVMWQWRKKSMDRLADHHLFMRLVPDFSQRRHIIKFVLVLLSLTCLIIAYANPQWGTKRQKVKAQSADIYIAIDISKSMLAEDVSPNRLLKAKFFIKKLIHQLHGERIGLIFFAGHAYLQMPLTNDYAAAELFLTGADTDMAPTQGTAITEAIALAEREVMDSDDAHRSALIVVTDGEDHDGAAISMAESASENSLFVYAVGVGTEKGGPIPEMIKNRQIIKKDENGQPIISQLNVQMLSDLASAGGGKHFVLNNEEDKIIESLKKDLEKLSKREMEQRVFKEYNSYFQYFLGFGLLLLLIDFFISYNATKTEEDVS